MTIKNCDWVQRVRREDRAIKTEISSYTLLTVNSISTHPHERACIFSEIMIRSFVRTTKRGGDLSRGYFNSIIFSPSLCAAQFYDQFLLTDVDRLNARSPLSDKLFLLRFWVFLSLLSVKSRWGLALTAYFVNRCDELKFLTVSWNSKIHAGNSKF